jgi:hypothetical protein
MEQRAELSECCSVIPVSTQLKMNNFLLFILQILGRKSTSFSRGTRVAPTPLPKPAPAHASPEALELQSTDMLTELAMCGITLKA